MNNLQLKAIRQGLGLEVSEAAELAGVQKRSFNYWEQGERQVPSDVDLLFDFMASHYAMVLERMIKDVERITIYNKDDDTKPSRVSPTLPFFRTFESFQMKTECSKVAYWRIYQSVISQLILLGKIVRLDDSKPIPDDFWIWSWLHGAFEDELH
jgi:DNA-binding XRE family transcriptional regulator